MGRIAFAAGGGALLLFAYLFASLVFRVADGQATVPAGFSARWRSEAIPGSAITPASEILSWRDDTSNFIASPRSSSLRPRAQDNGLFCRRTVRFQSGRSFVTGTTNQLDPAAGGFSVFIVSKQLNYDNWGSVIYKGTSTLSWSVAHGAGGGFSMCYWYRGGDLYNAGEWMALALSCAFFCFVPPAID